MSYTRGKGLLDGKSYRDVIQCWETGQTATSGDATLVTNGESLYHVIASPWYVGNQARFLHRVYDDLRDVPDIELSEHRVEIGFTIDQPRQQDAASPWYVGKQARHGKKLVNVWTADTNEFLSDAIADHVYDALRYADSEPVYPYTLQHVAL